MRTRALTAAVATGLALALPASAQAVNCSGLPGALSAADNGDTVTVDQGEVCTGPFTLPAGKSITLEGAGTGATLTGSDSVRVLDGADVGTTTIRNLTITDGLAPAGEKGGGIRITGTSTPTLDGLRFLGNSTAASPGADGGGLSISSTATSGAVAIRRSIFGNASLAGRNVSSDDGGALAVLSSSGGISIEVSDSQFLANEAASQGGGAFVDSFETVALTRNRFVANVIQGGSGSQYEGGGAAVFFDGAVPTATIRGNSFERNELQPLATTTGVEGAGLFVDTDDADTLATIESDGNLFDSNLGTPGGDVSDFSARGGGAMFEGHLTSRNDRFTRNSLPPALGAGTSWGAGLALTGCSPSAADGQLENAVVAGNSLPGTARGAGVYVGCSEGPANLTLDDSTVSGNTAGGDTAGVWGGSDDTLTLRNSIVAGNSGGADLTGFASKTASFSDACPLLGGAGNLCANPLLTAEGNETPSSPTVDKGSNALIPAGLTTDFDGEARIQGASVDMGADERAGVSATGQTADTTAPGVSRASLSNRSFAVARGPTPITGRAAARRKRKKRVKRGTTIRYTLSEPATARLLVERKLRGRRVTRRRKRVCVKPTRKNRKRRRCTRYKRAGRTLVRTSKAGRNKVKFSGRIGRKALRRGRYRLTIVAVDAAGNRSRARRVNFRIVKP